MYHFTASLEKQQVSSDSSKKIIKKIKKCTDKCSRKVMLEGGAKMARECPHCDSEMFEDYDHINRVRVLVCSKPTCLYRIYPDYPRRKSNEEVCFSCQRIFKVRQNDAGILCPECKAKVEEHKKAPANGDQHSSHKTQQKEVSFNSNHKARMRRAV